jgi:hypothetical protein
LSTFKPDLMAVQAESREKPIVNFDAAAKFFDVPRAV